jgi:hypothetical protein
VSLQQHGTNSSYSSGCRCDYCRAAHNDYARRQRMRQLELADASAAREWLRATTLPPVPIEDVARRTGVSVETLRKIRDGSRERTHRAVIEALAPWMDAR